MKKAAKRREIEFKVNAGITQYTQLKNAAQGRGRGREGQ